MEAEDFRRGLTAHLENVNAASGSSQGMKPPKSPGGGGGLGCKSLELSKRSGSFQNNKPARAVAVAKGRTFG